jgi:hypothetical protein
VVLVQLELFVYCGPVRTRDRYRYWNTGIEYRKYREKSERYSMYRYSVPGKNQSGTQYRYSVPGKCRAVLNAGIQYRENAERYSIPVFNTGKKQSGIEYRYSIARFFSSGIGCGIKVCITFFLRIKYNFILLRKLYFNLH